MPKAETIGIISIKGGVGKTTTVANLGVTLSRDFKKKVLLIDANLSSPNLGYHLGLEHSDFTLKDVLSDKLEIKKAIYAHELGFDVLPSSFSQAPDNHSIFKLKEKLKKVQSKYDYILLDSSPNLNNEMLLTMVAADKLVVITTPDRPTVQCTLEAIEAAKRQQTPISGLLINRRRNKSFEISQKQIQQQSEVPIIGTLPEDIKFLKALSKQQPLAIYSPRSKTSKLYHDIAHEIMGLERLPSFGSRIKNLFSNYISIESE